MDETRTGNGVSHPQYGMHRLVKAFKGR